MDLRTAFALLGTPPGSSPDAVRDAYRDLVKVWHPDRFAGDSRLQAKASERLRDINEAYRLVSATLPPEPRTGPAPPVRREAPAARTESTAAVASGAAGMLRRTGLDGLPWKWLGIAAAAILAAPFVLALLGERRASDAAEDRARVASFGDPPRPTYLDELTLGQAWGGAEPDATMRASSPGDLGERLQGRWVAMRSADGRLAPGAGIELRDGAVLWPVYPAVVGEYRALSRSTIRVDDTTSGQSFVYEVWFPTPTAMTWRVSVDGQERGRILFQRA